MTSQCANDFLMVALPSLYPFSLGVSRVGTFLAKLFIAIVTCIDERISGLSTAPPSPGPFLPIVTGGEFFLVITLLKIATRQGTAYKRWDWRSDASLIPRVMVKAQRVSNLRRNGIGNRVRLDQFGDSINHIDHPGSKAMASPHDRRRIGLAVFGTNHSVPGIYCL